MSLSTGKIGFDYLKHWSHCIDVDKMLMYISVSLCESVCDVVHSMHSKSTN